jgi:DNA-binding response OmpR family regulator
VKALLVIGDPSLRALWDGVLADHGHAVASAAADEVWDLTRQTSVDLVVLELVSGSTEALDLCRRIRRSPEPRPSLLVLVHPDQAAQMVAALKAGADDVLVGLPDRRAAITHLASLERRRRGVEATSPTAAQLAAGYQLAELSGQAPLALVTDEPGLPDLLGRLHAAAGDLAARLDATAGRADARAGGVEAELRAARNQALDLAATLDRLKAAARTASEPRAPELRAPEPGAPEPRAPEAPPSPAPPAASAGRATILLIDDEPAVRRPLRRALEYYGYDVLEAGDGQQGLDLFVQQHARINAVVVDQYMPRMSGEQVAQELKRRSAATPVILISGQNAPDVTEPRQGVAADAFLRKPFQLVDLASIVRRFVETAAA